MLLASQKNFIHWINDVLPWLHVARMSKIPLSTNNRESLASCVVGNNVWFDTPGPQSHEHVTCKQTHVDDIFTRKFFDMDTAWLCAARLANIEVSFGVISVSLSTVDFATEK